MVLSLSCYCLSLPLSLCHPLFFLGDVTSSEAVKWSQFLCCPPSIAAAHKQTVIIFCQGQDQCGEQSAHKTPLWRSDWFCTKYVSRTHARAHTDRHTHDHKWTGMFPQTCAHTQKKNKKIVDEQRHQTSPTFSPSCLVMLWLFPGRKWFAY